MVEPLPERMTASGRAKARLLRHVAWARRDGVGRLVEEDRLDPRERASEALARARWRRRHAVAPGRARGVLVVGVQRSGTNMLTRGLESMPEVEVHNENDRAVFSRFQLKSADVLCQTVAVSRHVVVLFKPICDSHDTDRLLDALAADPRLAHAPAPAALWAFRGVDDRVRSAVAKFGDVNQRVMTEIAAGQTQGGWQSQRLDDDALETIRSVDPERLSAESGAALFWWMRNRLYFTTGLDHRQDVLPVSYEQVVADPQPQLRRICDFVGLPFRPQVAAHIDQRAARPKPALELDPRVRALCDDLTQRLMTATTRPVRTL